LTGQSTKKERKKRKKERNTKLSTPTHPHDRMAGKKKRMPSKTIAYVTSRQSEAVNKTLSK